ncbi:MAG: DUF1499 domain-containing protein [Nitrospirae bacterium]|nr:DUF1499 domain-containing protein [Nitrospirota bacterium]
MGSRIITVVIVVLILPLAAGGIAIAMNRPMLFDPPGFAKRLSIYLRYNAAETAANPLLPELRIRRYGVSEDRMKSAVERTIRSLPRWTIIREERAVGAYQIGITSLIWRFRDDLSILVTGTASGEMEVYVFSVSRVGRADLGANRVHILTFYEALERQLKENS